MHSFINSIFSQLSSSLINAYAKSNTPTANQYTAQDSCHHATLRGNSHMEGPARWKTWAGSRKIEYCNHNRTGSAGSTEYWIWNGPDSEEPETSGECAAPVAESSSLGELSEQEQGGMTSLEKIEQSPRLCGNSIDRHSTPIQDDPPSLTLDSTTIFDPDFTGSYFTPLTPDLPSESFSPFLTATRLGLTNSKSTDEASPLFGLGIVGITRKGDPSQVFDGLGIVRVRSSPWRSRQPIFEASSSSGNDSTVDIQPEDPDGNISDTFLHDLEAFFLTRDFTDGCGPIFDCIVEEPKSINANGKEEPLAALSPLMSTPKKKFAKGTKTATSLTPRRPSHPPSNLCATVSGPNLRTSTSTTLAVPLSATLPRSCSASSSLSPSASFGLSASSSAQGSAGFVRSTCSAFKSQRGRICSSPFPSRSRHGPDNHGAVPSVSPSASARNLTVSVSMGPGPSVSGSSGGGLSMGNRSLQSHSVRDLSVVGTISSDLKKKMPVS